MLSFRKFHKVHVALFALIWFARLLLFPFILASCIHKLIIWPFVGRYLFKPIKPFSIITTGGTGGHVFPAIRMASYIKMREQNIHFVTNWLSYPLFEKLGYIHKNHFFYTEEEGECPGEIPMHFFKIYPLRKNVRSFAQFALAALQVFYFFVSKGGLVKNVIGFGGYASFHTLFFAKVFFKKIYLHEQNVVYGKVNHMFAPFATKVFEAFPTEVKTFNSSFVGMPLCKSLETRGFVHKQKLEEEITILVMAGSAGGAEFATVALAAIVKFAHKYNNVHVYHQCAGSAAQKLKETYKKHKIKHTIKPFFEEIHDILKKADFCISRPGASSIVDIFSAGVPGIFIPLQHSAGGHQLKNAAWVAHNNLGFMYKSWESNAYNLTVLIYLAMQNSQTNNFATQTQKAIKRNARTSIFNHVFNRKALVET